MQNLRTISERRGLFARPAYAEEVSDAPGLYVRTVAIPDPGPLVEVTERTGVAWIRNGEGMVGLGEVVRHKPVDAAEAELWWRELCRSVVVEFEPDESPVELFGSGLIAFGSFVFDPDNTAAQSVMIVPQTVIGRRDGRAWRTDVSSTPHRSRGESAGELSAESGTVESHPKTQLGRDLDAGPLYDPVRAPEHVAYADGALSGPEWEAAVGTVVRRIVASRNEGTTRLHKVVLARDLLARAAESIDPRWLIGRLAGEYRRCWTYQVDGLVGATPEMLVRREAGLATSRVLAGTIRRSADADRDLALAAALSQSSKDLEEHEYAVASVARALAPHCSGMNVPDAPYVLELPNVLHLATDVTAVADRGTSVLGLAAALHPSAAVCGTPTSSARSTIAELERMDRQRYAGPVGWIDAEGDGEWAIALRCGQLDADDPRQIRLFAGCGIVAGSDPAAELAEAAAKFVPMRDAIGL